MTLLFILVHLLILGLMATSAYGLGYWFTRNLRFSSAAAESDARNPAVSRIAIAGAVGFGGLGSIGLALGLVGLLTPWAVALVLIAIHLAALPQWKAACVHLRGLLGQRGIVLGGIFGAAVLLPVLVLPLYPPNAFDATMYHLPYAQLFGDEGRVVFAPHLRYPVFPQLVDLLFTLVLLVADDVSAGLVQTLAMGITAALVYGWGQHVASSRAGLWAAAIWLGNPLVVWNTRGALVDVSLALFVVAAAYGLFMWTRTHQLAWLAVSGAACGFAAGTKYHGVVFAGFLAVALAVDAVRHRRWKPLVCGLAATVLLALPWYARIYYHTGNPVFPFFTQVFGESEWSFHLHNKATWERIPGSLADDDPTLRLLTASYEVPEQLTRRIVNRIDWVDWLRIPWRLSFESRSDGRAPISPIYLFTLPWVVLFTWRHRLTQATLLVCAVYGAVWLTTADDPRYLLPLLGLMAVPTAMALREIGLKLPGGPADAVLKRRFTWLLGLLLMMPGTGYAVFKMQQMGPLPVTAEQRETYLSRSSKYAAISFLNQTYGADYTVYGLKTEQLVYHADGRLLGDHYGPARYAKIRRQLHDPSALHAELRRLGADFFLVPGCKKVLPKTSDKTLFQPIYRHRGICIYELSRSGTSLEDDRQRPPSAHGRSGGSQH